MRIDTDDRAIDAVVTIRAGFEIAVLIAVEQEIAKKLTRHETRNLERHMVQRTGRRPCDGRGTPHPRD